VYRVFIAVAAAYALLVAVPAPSQLKIVNLMPAFWSVWDSTQSDPAARVQAFKERVVLPGLAVYSDGEFRRDLVDDTTIGDYLTSLGPSIPQMRNVSKRLEFQLPALEQSFQQALPDFDADRVVIYFLPSFFHFNGQTHDIGAKIGVLFGVDGIVKYDGANENVGVDVAHELFHVYQYEMHPFFRTDEQKLWQAVWNEGSAAYASQMLTPGSTKIDALGADLAGAGPDTLKALACGVRAQADSRDVGDISAYIVGGKHPPNLPTRGGYLVGYAIAADAGRTYTVAQIGKLGGADLEKLVKTGVATLCEKGAL
jgi:hypothetical protein